MGRVAICTILLASFSALSLGGCTVDDRFNPRGKDGYLVVDGLLTVDNTSADGCTATIVTNKGNVERKVNLYELIIWNGELTESWRNELLRKPCNIDGETAFDSSNGRGSPLLRAGEYNGQWLALADNGDLLDCQPVITITIPKAVDPNTPSVVTRAPVAFQLHDDCTHCPCE
ncbi:MAG: hypothetical protein R3A47_04535 [Polyangiales bacterium]